MNKKELKEIREKIDGLKMENEQLQELIKKTYNITMEQLNYNDHSIIRWLADKRISENKQTIKHYKRTLSINETIDKITINQVYESVEFGDIIIIKNIIVENEQILIETDYKTSLRDDYKQVTSEYNKLLERLKRDYVLIKE